CEHPRARGRPVRPRRSPPARRRDAVSLVRLVRSGITAALVAAVLAVTGCTGPGAAPAASRSPQPGPRHAFIDAGDTGVRIVDGDDWTLPGEVRPAANSGFFSEEASPDDLVHVRSVAVSWRQLQPAPGAIDRAADGEAQGMHFGGLDAQLAEDGDFWMRIFASGEDWAPPWVADDC